MRLLITGAEGQLGKAAKKAFSETGHEVHASGKEALDIKDPKAVSERLDSIRPDVVLNCASFTDVDRAEEEWRECFLVNGIGARNLAQACAERGAVLVHFSTDYVFDGLRAHGLYTIADRPNPLQKYGLSKLLGEESVRDHILRFFIIRTSWLFGEGGGSFPHKVLGWASKGQTIRVVEDQISCPTYAADLALVLPELIETGRFGLYHITNSGCATRYEWARFILETTGWKGEVLPAKTAEFPNQAKRPAFSALDNFPLMETTGRLLPHWKDATERFLRNEEGKP